VGVDFAVLELDYEQARFFDLVGTAENRSRS